MAQKSKYRWLLQELCSKKARFSILDVYMCKNESIVTKYWKDDSGNYRHSDRVKDLKIKHFLVNLVEERCPKLEEFDPHKVLCVAYLNDTIRALTTNTILDMPGSRIYSMKFRSLHILPLKTNSVYFVRVIYNNKLGKEICCFKKLFSQSSAPDIPDKIKAFAISLSEFVYKSTGSIVRRMNFDMLVDSEGIGHLIKTHEIQLSTLPDTTNSKPTNILSAIFNPSLRKRNALSFNLVKKQLAKRQKHKSQFVKMMARTIDRDRSRRGEASLGMLADFKNLYSISDLLDGITATQPRDSNRLSVNMSKFSNASETRTYSLDKIDRFLYDAKRRKLNTPQSFLF